MADANSSIFNAKATEKLRSPDDLDKYVRVTNPSVWVVIIACVALLGGLLAWGVFGTVTTNVSAAGVCVNGSIVSFLPAEDAAKVSVGDSASVDGKLMEVKSISAIPVSREEAKSVVLSDYLVSTLVVGDWVYIVHFTSEREYEFDEGVPLNVSITIERIAPITLLFGKDS